MENILNHTDHRVRIANFISVSIYLHRAPFSVKAYIEIKTTINNKHIFFLQVSAQSGCSVNLHICGLFSLKISNALEKAVFSFTSLSGGDC